MQEKRRQLQSEVINFDEILQHQHEVILPFYHWQCNPNVEYRGMLEL